MKFQPSELYKQFMRLPGEPIVKSLLDADFYIFTMGKFIFRRYPDVRVRFGLTNRTTDVPLGRVIDLNELREELDHCRTLTVGKSDLHYLRGTNEYQERMFGEDYLDAFRDLQLCEYELEALPSGQLRFEVEDRWHKSLQWETIALCILSQLYAEAQLKKLSPFEQDAVFAEGMLRVQRNVELLRRFPKLTFCDFGTRRRASFRWQEYVDGVYAAELPEQFLGTSNTRIAADKSLLPMGTNAHQLASAIAALADSDAELHASNAKLAREWWEEYGYGLSIALPDTFGSRFFFDRCFTPEQLTVWKGSRQDSMDPYEYGEMAIRLYQGINVDPTSKLVIFSDGLTYPIMTELHQHFQGRLGHTGAPGTNTTNDLGLKRVAIVIKAIAANGRKCVKLSDNIAKAIGDPAEVERYKRVFGYTETRNAACPI